jgi:hydroxyacylglutathione hydrolase
MLVTTLAGDSFTANCYIVSSEATRRALIIDPGVQAERIQETVAELALSISCIALTHAHIDHCSALDTLRKTTGAQFAACGGEPAPPAAPRLIIPGLTFTPYQLPFSPDRLLKDGDVLTVDDIHLTVLHTPGHSADSLCFHGHGVVFSGDTLLRGKIGTALPGLFPGHDHGQLLESIHRKLLTLPDDTLVYPGHGAATTIGEERRLNENLQA